MSVLFGFKALLSPHPATPLSLVCMACSHRENWWCPLSYQDLLLVSSAQGWQCYKGKRAAQCPDIYENTHEKEGVLCGACCVGRPDAWEQLETVCNNSVLLYSIA